MPDLRDPYAHIEIVIENLKAEADTKRIEIVGLEHEAKTLDTVRRNLLHALELQKRQDKEKVEA